MAAYTQQYDMAGRFVGVIRTVDNASIPNDTSNQDYQAFLKWNALQPVPLSLADKPLIVPKVPRSLLAIFTDLQALTLSQKSAVWLNIAAGTPRLYLTDLGTNSAPIGTVDFLLSQATVVWNTADLNTLRMRLVAYYVQDNPAYLVTPAFAPTINIPGDM